MGSKRSSDRNYARTAYGIDISGGRVIAARAVRGRNPRWEKVDAGALTPENLGDLGGLANNENAWIAAAMPVKDSFTQRIQAPFPSETKARKVFKSLLDIHLPFSVESCECNFVDLRPTDDGKVESLAVGARSETVSKALESLKEAGMDPAILDHEGMAIWDLAQIEFPVAPDEFRLVAYAGRERFVVSAGTGKRFEMARNTLVEMDGDKPNAQTLKSIARRIKNLYSKADGPEGVHWIWTGPEADNCDYRSAVEKLVGEDKSAKADCANEPSTFLARALALRAVGSAGGYVNCRIGDFLHPAVASAKRRQIGSLLTSFLVLGIILCLANIGWDSSIDRSHQNAQKTLRQAALQITGMARVPKGKEVEVVERWAERRGAQATGLMQFFEKSTGQIMLDLIDYAAEMDVDLGSVDVQPGSLSIRGSASDWDTPRKLADVCGGYGYDVDLEREEAGADERVHFKIEGVRSEI